MSQVCATAAVAEPLRLAADERRFLLAQPGIGVQVVQGLESAGFHSLDRLCQVGALQAVMTVCEGRGKGGWANRCRSLDRALACAGQAFQALRESTR